MRSPGSKSPADLIVLGEQFAWLVQCKIHGVCPRKEWNALIEAAELAHAVPLIVYRDKRELVWMRPYMFKTGKKMAQPWVKVMIGENAYGKRVLRDYIDRPAKEGADQDIVSRVL